MIIGGRTEPKPTLFSERRLVNPAHLLTNKKGKDLIYGSISVANEKMTLSFKILIHWRGEE